MGVFLFEVWREGNRLKETEYAGPLTAAEALKALHEEDSLWTGKLTVSGSQVGLTGSIQLDSSKVHVLRLASRAGGSLCKLHTLKADVSTLTLLSCTNAGCLDIPARPSKPCFSAPNLPLLVMWKAKGTGCLFPWMDSSALQPQVACVKMSTVH